jgi:hypothetical protein
MSGLGNPAEVVPAVFTTSILHRAVPAPGASLIASWRETRVRARERVTWRWALIQSRRDKATTRGYTGGYVGQGVRGWRISNRHCASDG